MSRYQIYQTNSIQHELGRPGDGVIDFAPTDQAAVIHICEQLSDTMDV